jgi:hypothetical protein
MIPMLVLIILNHSTTSAFKKNLNPREKTSGLLLSSLIKIVLVDCRTDPHVGADHSEPFHHLSTQEDP